MKNTVYVVGMGPGKKEFLSIEADNILKSVDVIVGYTVYVELLREEYPGKEFLTTPMMREIERCEICFEQATAGKSVAMVCSGDAGVYGMASLMYEVGRSYSDIDLYIAPGITAALSGAARLGSPLTNDFCVISLSDLLTPWEVIEKRIRAAVMGDFAMAIYNPSSKKRKDYLKKTCEIMLDQGADIMLNCGYVENIGRDNERTVVLTLGELLNAEVNMFTTVFVGNTSTIVIDGKLVTKRGYIV